VTAGAPRELTAREAFGHRQVRTLITSSGALWCAITMQAAIVGKQVYDITGSELAIGIVGLCEFLPALLLVFVAGSVADRFNRRTVACVAIAGEALCSIAFAIYASTSPTAVWPIYIVAFVFGTFRSFHNPAMRAMPPMVAPPGGLPRVIALNSLAFTAATIIGPASSGFLYGVEAWLPYTVAAVILVLGVLSLSRLHFVSQAPASVGQRPSLHSAMEGLSFIRRTPILLAAIALDLFAVLFGGAVALLPAIAEDRLHVGDVGYGWLRAAPGIGAGLMAVVLAVRPVRRRVGRTLYSVVALFGVMTVVLGVTTSYVVAFAALIALSGADMVSMFIRSTVAPLVTPDDKRGRVLAVEAVFIGASNELGAFESGVAGQAFGTQAAVIGGGVATLGVVGIWWVKFTQLRDVDRFSDLSDGDPGPPAAVPAAGSP
jgi:MFS family permease